MIQSARVGRRLTVVDVAERAWSSRGLVHRIKMGEMGSANGATFEAATIPDRACSRPNRHRSRGACRRSGIGLPRCHEPSALEQRG